VYCSIACATVVSANWPNWRGPTLNGVSTETGLPSTWSPTQNVAWKLPLPAFSGSTPIIWAIASSSTSRRRETTGALELWAIDRTKQDVAWKRPLAGGNNFQRKQNMSSPSPVTDGKRVWVMTGVGILKAFDFDGKELWVRDIQKDYGYFGLNWGYASSPLLHQNALYVQVLHGMKTNDPSYVLGIDADTGKTMWRQERLTMRRTSPRTRTRRRRLCSTRAAPSSSSPVATWFPVTIS
jgi:outer membrane protein assembly factor BamB